MELWGREVHLAKLAVIQANNSTTAAQPGKRLALLVCNGSFPNVPGCQLKGPEKDAKLLETALSDPESCQFTVRTLLDRGLLEVRREIARACAEAGPEDTLLVYYSGNGLTGEDGSLYLLVADSERHYLFATALDAEFVLSQLRRSKCRKIVLLIDSCHAGAFFTNNRGIPGGLYAVTSCGATEACMDTPEGGAFTLALCEGVRRSAADSDGDGRVSMDDLYEFVKARLRAGGYSNIPQKWVWNVPETIFMSTLPRHIFLSYAREDMAAAEQLTGALEAEGVPVWIDTAGVKSGSWKERVTEGLSRSRALIILLTAKSLNSPAVRKELAFAAKKNVPIIPVQLGELPEESLPDWFTWDYDELHRHVLNPQNISEGVQRLVSAIQELRAVQGNGKVPPERS